MTSNMYSDSIDERGEYRRKTMAALWTPEAQERLTFLRTLPTDKLPNGIRSEMGYLEGYKNAAEGKGNN